MLQCSDRFVVIVNDISGSCMSDVKMAVGGSARGQMRPHSSKSPPFLLVGLFVVIAILAFNYWNASTKYAFSRKQVIRLSDKYQELNLKKQGIEKRNLDLADELNERKTEVMKCIAKNSADTTNCENRIRREKDEVLTQLSAVKLDNDNMRQKEIENQESLVSRPSIKMVKCMIMSMMMM